MVAAPKADTGLVFLKLYSHVRYIVYALNTAEKYINNPQCRKEKLKRAELGSLRIKKECTFTVTSGEASRT